MFPRGRSRRQRRRGQRPRARRRAPPRRRWLRRLVALAISLVVISVAVTAVPVLFLRDFAPPTTAYMLIARAADPATGLACEDVEYEWVGRESIAYDLRLAVVLAEDQKFLLHDGFDLKSIRKALRERESGRIRGASTISQQVAKNLFLWPGQSYLRKAIEAWFTVWIEALWSKQRILEMYLNVAQFGPCVFGAGAASDRFFGVPPGGLSAEQAALLATVLPNPKKLRAHNPGPYARSRQAEILELMSTHRGRGHLRGL